MKKMGRPTDELKDMVLRCRVNKKTFIVLQECSKMLNKNNSEVIRIAIDSLYKKLHNQNI